ncbi:probable 2' cyclic ADP-D-ribose synthase BdTIR isoform X3 [Cryptomeria japonica]|uniref:probable 2' cyclic ADP-D-ribose synthase BdTIR isoform X3 n=1 Tax=Cryptomeria japonica TaxID=3369 RepID=UPI0027DA0EDD|nr:probable 2' cyclic ADP-D-ribose synthase BdTIR isoform X3 [Cryptomeria japonica]
MASTLSSARRRQERDPFLVLEPPKNMVKSSLSAKQFDVFINHRGPDVKTTLAMQLYNSLKEDGIQAYLGSEETELGDSLSPTIKNAIISAEVQIAILSPRYAESPWCLAELALMFQTKRRIIPLFYHIQLSDLSRIENRVAEAFSNHEEKGRYPDRDIQQWKECLQNVAGIKGYELNGQNDDPNKVCKDIVSAVKKELQRREIPFQVAKYEVGLEDLGEDFDSHWQINGQMIDTIIGIYGIEGSGKTTLVKYLFKRNLSEFSGSTSLFDVRKKHAKDEHCRKSCHSLMHWMNI